MIFFHDREENYNVNRKSAINWRSSWRNSSTITSRIISSYTYRRNLHAECHRSDIARCRFARSCENALVCSVDKENLCRRKTRDDDDDDGVPVNPRFGVSDLSTNRRTSVMFDAAVVFYASTKRCASPCAVTQYSITENAKHALIMQYISLILPNAADAASWTTFLSHSSPILLAHLSRDADRMKNPHRDFHMHAKRTLEKLPRYMYDISENNLPYSQCQFDLLFLSIHSAAVIFDEYYLELMYIHILICI